MPPVPPGCFYTTCQNGRVTILMTHTSLIDEKRISGNNEHDNEILQNQHVFIIITDPFLSIKEVRVVRMVCTVLTSSEETSGVETRRW